MNIRSLHIVGWSVAFAAANALAQAPAPILQEVFPPAAQPGSTARITLAGKNLEKVTGLLFDAPGFHATLFVPPPPAAPDSDKDKGKDKDKAKKPAEQPTLTWDVAVDASVPPGLYDLRAVNALGVSAPRAIHVSPLPVAGGKEPEKGNPVEVTAETRVFGRVDPGEVERFRVKPSSDQRLVVDCLGERIDSKIDATLEVRDSVGRRVAFSRDRVSLDPLLAFDARAGEEYTIDLWDFTYRGAFPYLLSISAMPRAAFLFPPAAVEGADADFIVYGWNLPGGERLKGNEDLLEALPLKRAPIADAGNALPGSYRKTSGLLERELEILPPFAGAEPLLVAFAPRAVVVEKEPNDKPSGATRLAAPFEACGRFDVPGDHDWFSFEARKGQALEIEVRSGRLGAPCDPVLLVARRDAKSGGEKVEDLLYLDERKNGFPREDMFQRKLVEPSRDPAAVWNPPEDGEYLLQIRNRNGHGGLDAVYCLSVRAPEPGFVIAVTHSENVSGEAACVPLGGSQSYDVLASRSADFAGTIQLEAAGLPAGVTCPPVYLGPGETFTPIVFSAARDAAPWTGNVRIVATAEWKGSVIRRAALSSVMVYGGTESRHPLQYVHSRLATSLPIAVREPAAFSVTLEPAELTVYPGAKIALTAKATRAEGFTEPIQLAYQGLGEQANAEENGTRPAKSTIERDKAEQRLELTLKKELPYGERTFVVFATAQVEYPEGAFDPKPKKQRRRTTFAAGPATIHVAPPYALSAPEIAASFPAGGKLTVPFELRRLPGVDGDVEVTMELPKGAKGFSTAAVKLAKDAGSGEVVIESDIDAPLDATPAMQLCARAQIGGRSFEEKFTCPFVVRRTEPIRVALADVPRSVCRGGALRVPFRLERIGGVGGNVTAAVKAPADAKGFESQSLELGADARKGEVSVLVKGDAKEGDRDGLLLEAVIEKGGKKFLATAPLHAVHVVPAFDLGEISQARFGALRLELERHPELRPGEELRLRLKVSASSGGEASAEAMFPKSDARLGVVVDSTALGGGSGSMFPLRVQVTLVLPEGEVTEEHVVQQERQQLK